MRISNTQWRTPEFYGLPLSELNAAFYRGEVMRRSTTEDGGETWVVRFRGKQ